MKEQTEKGERKIVKAITVMLSLIFIYRHEDILWEVEAQEKGEISNNGALIGACLMLACNVAWLLNMEAIFSLETPLDFY